MTWVARLKSCVRYRATRFSTALMGANPLQAIA
jgi:hypothetical protein